MAYRTDAIRLRDGANAIQILDEPDPETIEGLQAKLNVVMGGAMALQSLDDLGSKEANDAAWEDMLTLERKANALEEKIKTLQNK